MFAVYTQPVRYGAKKMAKSNALVVMVRGPVKSDNNPNRWWIACFGNKSHYHQQSGVCIHVEELSKQMKRWHRQRTWWLPFGDNDLEYRKLTEANP